VSDIARKLDHEAEAVLIMRAAYAEIFADDKEALKLSIESQTNLDKIMRDAVARIADCMDMAASLKVRAKTTTGRRNRFERQGEMLRKAVYAAIQKSGQRKFELDLATVSVVGSPDAVVYEDETAIPVGYWKPGDPVLDRVAVRADLEAGKEIPGARLETNRTTLNIKFT